MAAGDACLLDSNILLRISKSDDPHQHVIARALRALIGQGIRLCYTSQTLGEFWNASTRPKTASVSPSPRPTGSRA
jgi:predicted nucleic acid-binding protein